MNSIVKSIVYDCERLQEKIAPIGHHWNRCVVFNQQVKDGELSAEAAAQALWRAYSDSNEKIAHLQMEMGLIVQRAHGLIYGHVREDVRNALLQEVLEPILTTQTSVHIAIEQNSAIGRMLQSLLGKPS